MLSQLAEASDQVRLALVEDGKLLPKLQLWLQHPVASWTDTQLNVGLTLQGLLSEEGDGEEVMEAVVAQDFIGALGAVIMKTVDTNGPIFSSVPWTISWAPLVLSQLIWIFDESTPESTVTEAVGYLKAYCDLDPSNIETAVSVPLHSRVPNTE